MSGLPCNGTFSMGGSGAWCLGAPQGELLACPSKPLAQWAVRAGDAWEGPCWLPLSNNQSYVLPQHHVSADPGIVHVLDQLLRGDGSGPAREHASIVDIGAGVGQYGHALLSLDERHRYQGCDGAPNTLELTAGFLVYCELTRPIAEVDWSRRAFYTRRLSRRAASLPAGSTSRPAVADWALALEAGEHISPGDYGQVMANLNAVAGRGLILSWAQPGQGGDGHVNEKPAEEVTADVLKMGFVVDAELTKRLRSQAMYAWFAEARDCAAVPEGAKCNSVMGDSLTAYRRIKPRMARGAFRKR
jgi:hypothetical protein